MILVHVVNILKIIIFVTGVNYVKSSLGCDQPSSHHTKVTISQPNFQRGGSPLVPTRPTKQHCTKVATFCYSFQRRGATFW